MVSNMFGYGINMSSHSLMNIYACRFKLVRVYNKKTIILVISLFLFGTRLNYVIVRPAIIYGLGARQGISMAMICVLIDEGLYKPYTHLFALHKHWHCKDILMVVWIYFLDHTSHIAHRLFA